MIKFLVDDTLKHLNAIPSVDGISDNISPFTMVKASGPIDCSKLRITFGAYAQVFEENTITNNQDTRSIGCISLSSFSNENDKYPFMNLNTGKVP